MELRCKSSHTIQTLHRVQYDLIYPYSWQLVHRTEPFLLWSFSIIILRWRRQQVCCSRISGRFLENCTRMYKMIDRRTRLNRFSSSRLSFINILYSRVVLATSSVCIFFVFEILTWNFSHALFSTRSCSFVGTGIGN